MKVIYESKLAKLFLFKGYSTITVGCFVFTKQSKEEMTEKTLNHESIHIRQWSEVSIASTLFFTLLTLFANFPIAWILISPAIYYLLYMAEYLCRLIRCLSIENSPHSAYRSISFEREAYGNECISSYLDTRPFFEFIKYYFIK